MGAFPEGRARLESLSSHRTCGSARSCLKTPKARVIDQNSQDNLAGLPGEEWIRDGLADLAAGQETAAALLVAIGYPRLRALGVTVECGDQLPPNPELRLYRLLGAIHHDEAHSQYNALIRRLI